MKVLILFITLLFLTGCIRGIDDLPHDHSIMCFDSELNVTYQQKNVRVVFEGEHEFKIHRIGTKYLDEISGNCMVKYFVEKE